MYIYVYLYLYLYIYIYLCIPKQWPAHATGGGLRISAGRRRRRQGAQRGRGRAAATVTRTLSPPLRLFHALPAKRPGPDRPGGRDGPDVAAALGHVTDARGGKLASEPRRRQPPNRTARLVGRAQRRLAAGSPGTPRTETGGAGGARPGGRSRPSRPRGRPAPRPARRRHGTSLQPALAGF